MKTKGLKPTTVPLLYRVNYPQHGQVGYLVKVNRRRHHLYEIFNFSQFPSQPACRKAAEKRAREMDRKYPRLSRREVAELHATPGSGVVGVRKCIKLVGGRKYWFWEASWSPKPNVVSKRLFSVHKYGNEQAKKLATQTRKKGLASMKG